MALYKDNVLIDPACGTAGFLVSSAEYIREHYEDEMTDEQWDHYGSTMFTGFDTDRTMLRISAMNLMLHSIANPEIDYKDSVSKQNQISGKYTICLANPPFKGTIDAESINDNLKAITNTNLSSKSLWMKLSYYLISLCRITLVDAKIVIIMKTCHVDNPSRRRDYAKSIFR